MGVDVVGVTIPRRKQRRVRFGHVETIEVLSLKHETRSMSTGTTGLPVECSSCERWFKKEDLVNTNSVDWYCSHCLDKGCHLQGIEASSGGIIASELQLCHRLLGSTEHDAARSRSFVSPFCHRLQGPTAPDASGLLLPDTISPRRASSICQATGPVLLGALEPRPVI